MTQQDRARVSSSWHNGQDHQAARVGKGTEGAGRQRLTEVPRENPTSHASVCSRKAFYSFQTSCLEDEEQQGRLRLCSESRRQRGRRRNQGHWQKLHLAM